MTMVSMIAEISKSQFESLSLSLVMVTAPPASQGELRSIILSSSLYRIEVHGGHPPPLAYVREERR